MPKTYRYLPECVINLAPDNTVKSKFLNEAKLAEGWNSFARLRDKIMHGNSYESIPG